MRMKKVINENEISWKLIFSFCLILGIMLSFMTNFKGSYSATGDYLSESALGANVKNIYLNYVYSDSNYRLTEKECNPYITYMDREGNNTKNIFMDTFLFLHASSYVYSSTGKQQNGSPEINQADWEGYINHEIQDLEVLNTAIQKINDKNNTNIKVNIILSVVMPNENKPIKSSLEETIKYYVDSQITAFKNKKYSNLNLIGFYWWPEGVRSTNQETIIKIFTNYVKSKGYKTLWIPYIDNYGMPTYWDEGNKLYQKGLSEYGFNAVALQTGYYFHGNDDTFLNFHKTDSRLKFSDQEAKRLKMGLEVESDHNVYSDETKFNRYIDYLKFAIQNGWNSSINTYYIPGINSGATAKNDQDRKAYEFTYKYANETLTLSDLNISYSRDYNTNYVNLALNKSYTSTKPYSDPEQVGDNYHNISGKELTDGLYGNGGTGTNWIAFHKNSADANNNHWINIDLGQKYNDISHVGLELEYSLSWGIDLPKTINVYYSDDNTNWTKMGTTTYYDKTHIGFKYAYVDIETPISARYVKIVFDKGTSAFVFISEVNVGQTASVKLAKESGNVIMDSSPLSIGITKSTSAGTLSASSSNPKIATASISENNLIITPISEGETTITVTESKYKKKDTFKITVLSKDTIFSTMNYPYDSNNKIIFIGTDDNISTILSNIVYKDPSASMQIYDDSNKIIENKITGPSTLKIIQNGNTVDSYNILRLTINNDIKVLKNTIKYIAKQTTVNQINDLIQTHDDSTNIIIYNSDNTTIKASNNALSTGDILKIQINNKTNFSYNVSILGDSNGDSIVDLVDLVQMRKHIVGWVHPTTNIVQKKTGVYSDALDLNKDEIIDLIDLVKMRKIIAGVQ